MLQLIADKQTKHVVYNSLTSSNSVRDEWKWMYESVIRRLKSYNIVHVLRDQLEEWTHAQNVILNNITDETVSAAVQRVLEACEKVKVCQLPAHIVEIVQGLIKEISPADVRPVLTSGAVNSLLEEEKIAVLSYVLSDMPKRVAELHGLSLIPLEDGGFHSSSTARPSCARRPSFCSRAPARRR